MHESIIKALLDKAMDYAINGLIALAGILYGMHHGSEVKKNSEGCIVFVAQTATATKVSEEK